METNTMLSRSTLEFLHTANMRSPHKRYREWRVSLTVSDGAQWGQQGARRLAITQPRKHETREKREAYISV